MIGALPPGAARPDGASETEIASAVKALTAAGDHEAARELFGTLVARQQRRALRIALGYLRDAADADEAVQDAFVKAYSRLASYRPEWPFEVWFTRILINRCLDRLKARSRRSRWMTSLPEAVEGLPLDPPATGEPSPEERLLAAERQALVRTALAELPERQRLIFVLTHFEGCTPREVSGMTGLSESTVRVHLFRAIRRLRSLLTRREDSPSEKRHGLRTLS